MAGKAGRSGRKPKPTAELIAAGTFRRDRHGRRPDAPLALVPPSRGAAAPAVQPVAAGAADLEDVLAADGAAFGQSVLAVYTDWSPSDRMLLRCAVEQIDRIRQLRAAIEKDGLLLKSRRGTALHPAARAERQAVTVLAGLLAKLNLR